MPPLKISIPAQKVSDPLLPAPPSHIPKPTSLPMSSKPSADASLSCVEQLLQHLSVINSPTHIPSVAPVLVMLPSRSWPVLPTPTTLEMISVESPQSTPDSVLTTSDSDSESSSDSNTPHSTCSAVSSVSTWVLWPRLPITYNKAALSWLHGRPQMRTLYKLSIPLPLSDEEWPSPSSSDSDEQGSPANAEANSPTKLSPTSTPEAWLLPEHNGGVTNTATTRPSPQTRGGVTSTSNPRFPVDESPLVQSQKMSPLTSPEEHDGHGEN